MRAVRPSSSPSWTSVATSTRPCRSSGVSPSSFRSEAAKPCAAAQRASVVASVSESAIAAKRRRLMQHWGLTPSLHRLVGAALVAAALAGACKHGGGPPGHPAAAGHPCTGAAPPRYEHVVTIGMENHGFSQVVGHSPFLNALADRCGLATDYRAVTHPSLPNYLALVSGSTQGL